jgi:flavodoxin
MSHILTAYFSATGTTKEVAEKVAEVSGSDLFEIVPETKYSAADLDWMDKSSRSSLEAKDNSIRPAIASKVENMNAYDTVIIGFPIWWYRAPSIILAFLESYDFSNKKILLFATSGSSQMGNTAKILKKRAPQAQFVSDKRFPASVSKETLKKWLTDNGL